MLQSKSSRLTIAQAEITLEVARRDAQGCGRLLPKRGRQRDARRKVRGRWARLRAAWRDE
jgi:hypothetical protein